MFFEKGGKRKMLENGIVAERRRVTPLMLRYSTVLIGIVTICFPVSAIERRHGVLVGAVTDVSSATKTVAVKTADGTEHTFVFSEHTTVHGAKEVGRGGEDAFKGVEKGSKVIVHYTAGGGKETADEVDKIGDDGLKAVKVSAVHIGRGAKIVTVKTADGAEETFRVTGRASEEIGKEVGKGTDDAAKGTVYVTDEAGHKVVHFFERAF
jgi:hypothetical protein